MRVLDTRTGQFKEIDPKKAKYAILSHTWDRNGEQTYHRLRKIQKRYAPSDDSSSNEDDSSPAQSGTRAHSQPTSGDPPLSPIWGDPKLSPKIREACRVARENGYDYLWIDSCCIDKTSSSELSESINSMYQWYTDADVCYAFLPDVAAGLEHWKEGSHFRRSRWFTRGWTLQELIAPKNVWFLSMEWRFIESKEHLAPLVMDITGINYNALLHIEPLDEFSVAQRLSWTAGRRTTRVEDRAYSLLGIFDINMPAIYGEGERAFWRLQEEIMRRTPDQSLFAWTGFWLPTPSSQIHAYNRNATNADEARPSVTLKESSPTLSFLSLSLADFRECTFIEALSHDEVARRLQLHPKDLPVTDYDFTPHGIRTQLPVISFSDYFPPDSITNDTDVPLSQWYLVILGCGHQDFPGHLRARACRIDSSGPSIAFLFSGDVEVQNVGHHEPPSKLSATLTPVRESTTSIQTLYIPQPKRSQVVHYLAREKRHEMIKLVLSKTTREALSAQGYTATLHTDGTRRGNVSVTLSHDIHDIAIYIDFPYNLEEHSGGRQQLTVMAHVNLDPPSRRQWPGSGKFAAPLASTRAPVTLGPPWARAGLQFHAVHIGMVGPPRSVSLTMKLGLTFATTNHYFLDIGLETADLPAISPRPDDLRP